ncbi:ABC transporter substrate-binding protein [Ornithinibacillus sp. 4-3]|uniref:ABC transporter substrate-binding protein n=1 Tax=Ornithinibacillus sp. 4-3 TaxID=3231488 RepID=A0AB39HPZ9_9BACI
MKKIFLFMMLAFILVIAACSNNEDAEGEQEGTDQPNSSENTGSGATDSEPKGELKVGIMSQPTTLDAPMTTEAIVRDISINIYETLLTLDEENKPVPMLAESVEANDEGTEFTFKLREGVKFHNGSEMTSEDVLASMNRWKEVAGTALAALQEATFEAPDEYTFVMTIPSPQSDILDLLAGQGQYPAIMPKEVIDEAGSSGVNEYIGTGPFKFEEWRQDQYIHLTAFTDYVAVDEPASGLAGKKAALVEDLYFYITKDTSTLLTGVQTGEFDIAFSVAFDNYEQVKNDENLNVYSAYFGTMNLVYNKKEGPFQDVKMRQAVNAALNASDAMLGAFANEELYRMGHSYMNQDVANWYSEAGEEGYNQADVEKAKQLLEEAGYNGEELTLLTSRDIEYHYNIAVIVQEQLKQIGMNVSIDVYDWATHVEKRGEPGNWDLLTAGFNYSTTPTQIPTLRSDWPGWTDDPKISEMMSEIGKTMDLTEGKAIWDELQAYSWTEYVPFTQFGAVPVIIAANKNVENLVVMDRPIMMPLWNTSINK